MQHMLWAVNPPFHPLQPNDRDRARTTVVSVPPRVPFATDPPRCNAATMPGGTRAMPLPFAPKCHAQIIVEIYYHVILAPTAGLASTYYVTSTTLSMVLPNARRTLSKTLRFVARRSRTTILGLRRRC